MSVSIKALKTVVSGLWESHRVLLRNTSAPAVIESAVKHDLQTLDGVLARQTGFSPSMRESYREAHRDFEKAQGLKQTITAYRNILGTLEVYLGVAVHWASPSVLAVLKKEKNRELLAGLVNELWSDCRIWSGRRKLPHDLIPKVDLALSRISDLMNKEVSPSVRQVWDRFNVLRKNSDPHDVLSQYQNLLMSLATSMDMVLERDAEDISSLKAELSRELQLDPDAVSMAFTTEGAFKESGPFGAVKKVLLRLVRPFTETSPRGFLTEEGKSIPGIKLTEHDLVQRYYQEILLTKLGELTPEALLGFVYRDLQISGYL